MKRKTLLQSFLLAFVIILGFVLIPRAPEIGDRFRLINYQPTEEIEKLADNAGMNQRGRRLFYVYSPEFSSQPKLDDACGKATKPIGCISGTKILIKRPQSKSDNSEATVTAAHEMLHVAYSRLTKKDKAGIDELINNDITNLDTSIRDDIEEYRGSGDKIMVDEAYAIIGSEANNLVPELEKHYAQFFSNRQKTVSAYEQSQAAQKL